MDQYSPTYFSIISSNRLEPKFNNFNNIYSDHEEVGFHDHCSSDLKSATKTIKKESKMKRDYVPISNRFRLELIEAVYKYGEQIKIAAQRLGINYSSAKAICQVYRREGRSNKKLPRTSPSREERVAYTVEDTPVFVTCSGDSPKDSIKENETQDFSDNVPLIEEPLLFVKDPVMKSYPQIQKAEKQVIVTRVEEVLDCRRHQIFSGIQPQVSDHKQKQTSSKKINPKIVKTTVLQQPLIYPATEQSTVRPPLMPLLASNAVLPDFIPNLPAEMMNRDSLVTFNHPSLIKLSQLGNFNHTQLLKMKAQQMPNYENMTYVLPQGISHPNVIYPPPQQQLTYVYVYGYPQQATNIVSTRIGGVSRLLDQVYHMPTQNINPQLMANAFVYRAPHN